MIYETRNKITNTTDRIFASDRTLVKDRQIFVYAGEKADVDFRDPKPPTSRMSGNCAVISPPGMECKWSRDDFQR
jgi:hypothetical protein